MKASFKEVRAAVDLANLLVTVKPGYDTAAAAGQACDIAEIFDASDRRAVKRLLEHRRSLVYGARAAA